MTELAEWLREQLDDIEFSDWHERTCQTHRQMPPGSPLGLAGSPLSCNCAVPEFVLRDVAAKRRILDEVVPKVNALDDKIEDEWGNGGEGPHNETSLLLKLMAVPFADRPGYLEEWRP